MTTASNRNCPLSEDFFYWPPEEISQYKNWCQARNTRQLLCQHTERPKKAIRQEKVNKRKI